MTEPDPDFAEVGTAETAPAVTLPTLEETLTLIKNLQGEIAEELDGIAASRARVDHLETRLSAAKKLFKKLARSV